MISGLSPEKSVSLKSVIHFKLNLTSDIKQGSSLIL